MLNVDLLPIITFEYNMCYELWLWFMNIYMELIAFSTNIINNIYARANGVTRRSERKREKAITKMKMRNIPIFLLKSVWICSWYFSTINNVTNQMRDMRRSFSFFQVFLYFNGSCHSERWRDRERERGE